MELTKYKSGQVLAHIRHDLRALPEGKSYGNESINPNLSNKNYSLIDRGSTKEVNEYRKRIERECFKFNRKDVVHAVEICIQCPSDCPIEQHELFFKESHNYICSTLPMGEKCVFISEVHKDEQFYSPTGELVSKEHLHIMYVPAVPDHKHADYEYKLCADALTRKKDLKNLHPGLQKHLDECGIQATVTAKKAGDGKQISLTVKQLKELTRMTGVTIEKSLTIDNLAEIINRNIELNKEIESLRELVNNRSVSRWGNIEYNERDIERW